MAFWPFNSVVRVISGKILVCTQCIYMWNGNNVCITYFVIIIIDIIYLWIEHTFWIRYHWQAKCCNRTETSSVRWIADSQIGLFIKWFISMIFFQWTLHMVRMICHLRLINYRISLWATNFIVVLRLTNLILNYFNECGRLLIGQIAWHFLGCRPENCTMWMNYKRFVWHSANDDK